MPGRKGEPGGRFPPVGWPNWNVQCSATSRTTGVQCRAKATVGMPVCRFHGGGGERIREHGRLRYLAWVIIGGPSDMPAQVAATLAMQSILEMVFNQGKGTLDQKLKAAYWITAMLDKD